MLQTAATCSFHEGDEQPSYVALRRIMKQTQPLSVSSQIKHCLPVVTLTFHCKVAGGCSLQLFYCAHQIPCLFSLWLAHARN